MATAQDFYSYLPGKPRPHSQTIFFTDRALYRPGQFVHYKGICINVDTERDNADSIRALEDAIRGLPEVIACHYISGAGTFELQVLVPDLDAYSRWTMDTLFKLPNIKDLHTSFSLGEVKQGAPLPLGHLRAARAA